MPASLLLCLCVLAAPQDPTPTPKPSPGARFGYAVCALPDVDKDGTPDFAVSAPYEPAWGGRRGVVLLYSGATRTVIRRLRGHSEDPFGAGLILFDDLDGDGLRDLMVACDGSRQWQVVSMVDGALLDSYWGGSKETINAFLGHWSLASVGDLDGDGYSDLASGTHTGLRWISGRTKRTLRRTGHGSVIQVVGALDDRDGDGVHEVLVRVRARVGSYRPMRTEVHFSASDGIKAVEHFLPALGPRAAVRDAVGTLREKDLDGDGITDPLFAWFGPFGGYVRADSGRAGERLWEQNGVFEDGQIACTGSSFAWLPDQNGDGVSDLLVGGCDQCFHGVIYRWGAVWILSGADGSVLWRKAVAEVLGE